MQVIVNRPNTEETIKAFNEQFALFHSKLLLEKIKNLNIKVEDKEKVLDGILKNLNNMLK